MKSKVNNKKKTTEEFKKEVFDLVGDEYSVLGEYENNKKNILMKHNTCKHNFFMRPLNFLKLNNRCPYCAGLKKKTTEEFKKEVFDLVGDEYSVLGEYENNKTHLLMKHNTCGNQWNANPKWFIKGTRCPICQHRSFKKTTEEFKKEVFDLVGDEYSVLGEYENNKTHLLMKHNTCGYEYLVRPQVFLNMRRCPECSRNKSKLEENTAKFLNENNINFIREYSPNDLKGKNNRNIKYDFYLPEYELFIELDGIQHFKMTGIFSREKSKFYRRNELDQIKNEYCKINQISLLRIKYSAIKRLKQLLYDIFIDEKSSTTIESSKDVYYIDENGNEFNKELYYE